MSKTLLISTNLSRIAKGMEGFEVDGETNVHEGYNQRV
jgi:hypothetical protein